LSSCETHRIALDSELIGRTNIFERRQACCDKVMGIASLHPTSLLEPIERIIKYLMSPVLRYRQESLRER
jgi:hypothetical protein